MQSVSDVVTELNDGTISTRLAYVKSLEEQVLVWTALSEGRPVTEKLVEEFDPLSRDFGVMPAAQPAAEEAKEAAPELDSLLN